MKYSGVIGSMMVCLCTPLLFVGITHPLVHFEVKATIIGQHIKVLEKNRALLGGDDPNGKKGEKIGIINDLWQQEAYFAAGLLFIFGVAIPVVKLVVFALWLSEAFGQQFSAFLLQYGRSISKWAAVDAVCEALLVGILMKVGAVNAYHDIGFPCFVAYCIISSLAFTCLPGKVQVDDPEPNWAHKILARRMQSPRRRVYLLVTSLTIFLVLLGVGGSLHVARLWIPKEEMVKSINHAIRGNPAFAALNTSPVRKQLEEQLASKLVDVNASISGAVSRLLSAGHFYTVIGSIFLSFCTIFLPVLYAVLSVCKAITVSDLSDDQKQTLVEGNSDAHVPWWPELDTARTFAHDLSMLDVMIVGTIVGHLAMDGEPFMKSEVLPGFFVLLFSGVSWHLHKFLCRACQISEHAGGEEPNAEPGAEPVHG